MNYSKETQNFAQDLVSNYATFNRQNNCYTIFTSDLSDFDIHELSALIMKDNPGTESEATSQDNPLYLTKMVPALSKMLSHSTSKDEQLEFVNVWRDCVSNYFMPFINNIVLKKLDDYNQDQGHTNNDIVHGNNERFVESRTWNM